MHCFFLLSRSLCVNPYLCCISSASSSLAWHSTACFRLDAASKSGWIFSVFSKQITDLLYSANTYNNNDKGLTEYQLETRPEPLPWKVIYLQ